MSCLGYEYWEQRGCVWKTVCWQINAGKDAGIERGEGIGKTKWQRWGARFQRFVSGESIDVHDGPRAIYLSYDGIPFQAT